MSAQAQAQAQALADAQAIYQGGDVRIVRKSVRVCPDVAVLRALAQLDDRKSVRDEIGKRIVRLEANGQAAQAQLPLVPKTAAVPEVPTDLAGADPVALDVEVTEAPPEKKRRKTKVKAERKAHKARKARPPKAERGPRQRNTTGWTKPNPEDPGALWKCTHCGAEGHVAMLFGWRQVTRTRRDGTTVVETRTQPWCRPCRASKTKAA